MREYGASMDTQSARNGRRAGAFAWVVLAGSLIGAFSTNIPAVAEQPRNQLSFNPIAMAAQAGAVSLVPRRTNILLLGIDNASKKKQKTQLTRSDTAILLTCDPVTRRVSLVSIPRDSRVPIPGHGHGKLNSAHAYGGPALAMKTVRSAFNVPVDHYMVVDTSALRKVFEMVGPLEVNVDRPMKYTDHAGKLHIDLKSGKQMLNPAQVEQYVRFRHSPDADIGRIRRQQYVLMETFKKVSQPGFVVSHLPLLISTVGQSVKTDLTFEQLGRFALFGLGLQTGDISMASIPGHAAIIRRISYWIVNNAQAKVLFDKFQRRQTDA
jgi:polyisoprenyl-teichoic acid--peptidoglycan teichoic acid transferase